MIMRADLACVLFAGVAFAQGRVSEGLRSLGSLPRSQGEAVLPFAFSSERDGWAWDAYQGVSWTTEDGGQTWRSAQMPQSWKGLVEAVFPESAKSAWAWVRGDVFRTDDGGGHWTRIKIPGAAGTLKTAWFEGSRGFVLVGSELDRRRGIYSPEAIYRTTDGAQNWRKVLTREPTMVGDRETPTQFQFADSNVGAAYGPANITATRDGGTTWIPISLKFTEPKADYFFIQQVFFSSASRGWVLEERGSLFRTDDGEGWQRILNVGDPAAPAESRAFTPQIYFASTTHGWLLTRGGRLFESQDGGSHWSAIKGEGFVHLTCSRTAGCRVADINRRLYFVSSGQEDTRAK